MLSVNCWSVVIDSNGIAAVIEQSTMKTQQDAKTVVTHLSNWEAIVAAQQINGGQ